MLKSEEISAEHIKSGLGGYNKKATREYVDGLREEYDSLCKENMELKDKLSVLSEGVQYYKNMEKSLQKALVLAERTTSETIHAAEVKALAMEKEAKSKADVLTKEAQMKAATYEKEAALKADAMIRDAKQQADSAIAQGNEELRKVHSQIMTLIQQYEQYKSQYKQLALAQMNVLESEAYTLEAPILKMIQGKFDNLEGQYVKSQQKEDIADNVVHPISLDSSSMNSNKEDFAEHKEKEKQMYIDGRGELYEVHDFREVSIPGSKNKDFDDFSNASIHESRNDDFNDLNTSVHESENDNFDDFSEMSTFGTDKKQRDEYFKAFDTPDTKSMTEQEGAVANINSDNHISGHMEQEEDPYVVMKRIEKMQLERLRREEEQQTEFMKHQKIGYEYETQNLEEETSKEQPVSDNSYQEEATMDFSNRRQTEEEDADFLSMLHNDDDRPIDLSELKQRDMENQSEVPLPKASEEDKNYFSEFPNEMKAVSFDEDLEETHSEVSSAGYNVNTEKEYQYTTTHAYENEAEKNSLSYAMDHGSHFESNGREKEGFKSFRDFESEL